MGPCRRQPQADDDTATREAQQTLRDLLRQAGEAGATDRGRDKLRRAEFENDANETPGRRPGTRYNVTLRLQHQRPAREHQHR